jgi:hypothetical protein
MNKIGEFHMQLYSLPAIDYLRLRFHLKAIHDSELPSWKGSLLRGAFGHALKKTVCTMRPGQRCDDCMLRFQCAYTRIFETFITEQPPPFLKGLDSSPRPFIFEPHDSNKFYKENDILWFDLILIGNAVDFMPYLVFSIFQMGHSGLGVRRHLFDLSAAYCFQPESEDQNQQSDPNANWRMLYDGESQRILFTPLPQQLHCGNSATAPANDITLKFLTQTRLKFGDSLAIDFTFRMLVFKMLRRVLELAYFYSAQAEINWEFHDLLVAANEVQIAKRNLQWVDYDRYSNRQQTKMKLGGFVGDLRLEGVLAPFWDLLNYSEVLHVGKGTTFGLGRIEMVNK